MSFENPYYLLLLPVALVALWARVRPSALPALQYSSLAGLEALGRSWRERLIWLPAVLRAAAVAMVILAFARPRTGLEQTRVTTEGVDIVLALDVSGSMRADDLEPDVSRMDVVKGVAEKFVAGRKHDRIGLVVFAKHAFRQVPLTLDRDLVRELLREVRIGIIPPDKTAIGSALATAVGALKGSRAKSKVVILLTDGVSNFGRIDPATAAELARTLGIKVYAIGAGADRVVQGLLFPRQVRAEIDEKTLQEIAETTGGLYFRARNRSGLEAIYEQIDQLEKTRIEVARFTRYREHFAWFLIPALGLLLAELGLSGTVLRVGP